MATTTNRRLKILQSIRGQPHRYDRLRVLGMVASTVTLFAVPLLGLARVDLWRGHHVLLFKEVPFKHGLAGLIVAIAALYVVTFLSNVAAARVFCGWGCPVGQANRLAESWLSAGRGRSANTPTRVKSAAANLLFAVLLALAVAAWWVDLRVLWQGSPRALAVAWSALAAGAIGLLVHARWWRWGFCQSLCPIGLYYSFVSPARWFGVHYRNQEQTCLDCDLCDGVCPVDLEPRTLMAAIGARPGLSIADAPGRNHCIECGDCVRACEWIIDLRGRQPAPLLLGYFDGPQRIEHASRSQDTVEAEPPIRRVS